jgi:hypothetical protein
LSNNIEWDFIVDKIFEKKCTPVISNQVVNGTLFGEQNVVEAWANKVGYPLADRDNLTRVAQFFSVTKDISRAKSNYLRFLRRNLFDLAEKDPNIDPGFLSQLKRERALTFSQIATEKLRYPNFAKEPDHPLTILATMDIEIYLTTSHHHFMEAALKASGKNPRTEVYPWRQVLEDNIPVKYRSDLDFVPDVENPLVYHLHGIDDYADSLVLTEDDHLEFLVNVTQDIKDPDITPSTVRNALSGSLLILMGYRLHDWDLLVLLEGLIKSQPDRPPGYSVQFVLEDREHITNKAKFDDYLQKYFANTKFDVYLGKLEDFAQTLWEELEAG